MLWVIILVILRPIAHGKLGHDVLASFGGERSDSLVPWTVVVKSSKFIGERNYANAFI